MIMQHVSKKQRLANRWAVVAVLSLATAYGTTSPAAIVQITQSGNAVTPFADNLDADLTGDGIAELTITDTSFFAGGIYQAATTLDGQGYLALGGTTAGGNTVLVTGVTSDTAPEGGSAALSHYFLINFSDAAYGLTDEEGWVEVFLRADDTAQGDSGVFIRRLIFDPDQRGTPGFDPNASLQQSYPEAQVPEPGLAAAACLALAGLIRRR